MSRSIAALSIEVCAYADAPWAPGRDIGRFQWAWRVQGTNGYEITGACNGTQAYAKQQAKKVAERLSKLRVAGHCGDPFRINRPLGEALYEQHDQA